MHYCFYKRHLCLRQYQVNTQKTTSWIYNMHVKGAKSHFINFLCSETISVKKQEFQPCVKVAHFRKILRTRRLFDMGQWPSLQNISGIGSLKLHSFYFWGHENAIIQVPSFDSMQWNFYCTILMLFSSAYTGHILTFNMIWNSIQVTDMIKVVDPSEGRMSNNEYKNSCSL